MSASQMRQFLGNLTEADKRRFIKVMVAIAANAKRGAILSESPTDIVQFVFLEIGAGALETYVNKSPSTVSFPTFMARSIRNAVSELKRRARTQKRRYDGLLYVPIEDIMSHPHDEKTVEQTLCDVAERQEKQIQLMTLMASSGFRGATRKYGENLHTFIDNDMNEQQIADFLECKPDSLSKMNRRLGKKLLSGDK